MLKQLSMTINAGEPSEKLLLQMKRFQEQNELKTRDEKIKLMNDRQKQWMEERKGSRPSNSQVTNQGKAQGGVPHHLPKPKKQNSSLEKKTSNEVLLWTSKNPEITSDGFVVRKPPGKSGSRALSRSSKSNSTSRPSSSRSAAGQEVDRETRSIRRLENTLDLMTSTPERTLSSDVADFEITKDISSIRISAMKDKEKVSNTNGNLPVHSSHQLSTYIEDGQEEKSNYKGFSILGNSSYKPIIHIGDKQNGNSTFAMHCCPSCNTLMSLQSHRPFLIIPCGHNVCAQCQPVQTDCPTCNTRISSTVENTALSHVIKEHKKQADREELARKEEEARKFVEEYDSLKTRCDVLSCKSHISLAKQLKAQFSVIFDLFWIATFII